MDTHGLCTQDEAHALSAFLFGGSERTEDEVKEFVKQFQSDKSKWTPRLAQLIRLVHLNQALDAYDAHGATIERCPGYGLPIEHAPAEEECFPRLAAADVIDGISWAAATLLIRELCILRVMEELTNKPDWWLKVNDEEIANKWRQEVLEMDYKAILGAWAIVTPAMADAIIDELRAKAALYQKTGLIPVMDYSACAIKSDTLMPDDLVQRLKAAIAPFENVSDEAKDWHPGSDGKVLDLVHPSLWPLRYGRSRVLPTKTIGLADCLKHCGTGVTLPHLEPAKPKKGDTWSDEFRSEYFQLDEPDVSTRYQWLPCEVSLAKGRASITSYINNVHPINNADLYPVIESFINLSLPAWDLVLRWPKELEFKRMHWTEIYKFDCTTPDICNGECHPRNCPISEGGIPNPDDAESDDEVDEDAYYFITADDPREQWFARTHTMILPDPEASTYCDIFAKPDLVRKGDVANDDDEAFFGGASKCQVIVKLANIHLTPDKPTYDGGSWHVEGQLNERIAATALFYYDSDNISDSALAFRTCANKEDLSGEGFYEQGDFLGISRALGISESTGVLQELGQVSTRPGRALFFPNLYQHRVSPFELVDRTRPGHRKILALFLVDPQLPVLSTANVPPQQRHWWEQELSVSADEIVSRRLPVELSDMVLGDIDFPISLDDAKAMREDLMAERKVLIQNTDSKWEGTEFNFCEH